MINPGCQYVRELDATGCWDIAGKRLFLIGIGGCGLSGLAQVLLQRGAIINGSDQSVTALTRALQARGISVVSDLNDPLPEECDLVITSAAIRPDHPQVIAAAERGVPTLTYAEALGRSMLGRTGVAVAGTHGKSTTVGMLAVTLISAGLDPTVIVGATCPQLDDSGEHVGFRLGADAIPRGEKQGDPGLLLCEACEFNRSFHNLAPRIGAITSVEADHLDIYGSLDAVVQAFNDFARLIPPADEGGRLLIAHEGAMRSQVTAGVKAQVETIGLSPEADWQVVFDPGKRNVLLRHQRADVARWTLAIPGEHNAMNSAFAAVLSLRLGADPVSVARGLSAFRGVDRRMQLLGEKEIARWQAGGVTEVGTVRVYDDYGHHPTEVDATLRALREFERPELRGGRLICVFQPHQHSRTRFLLDEFAQAFRHADVVIVPHIYFVRDSEVEKSRVSATDLVDRLRERNVLAMHLYPFEAIVEQLQNLCRPDDLLVVMGAGPVWKVAHEFMNAGNGGAEA